MPLFIIKNHGLPVGADHQVVGMRHDESLLVAENNANRLKRLGMHQFFNLICDHRIEAIPVSAEGKWETLREKPNPAICAPRDISPPAKMNSQRNKLHENEP